MTGKTDIILKDVSFSYNGEPILENVNLEIEHGDFSTIVGPNGGGKTTLLKLLLGLLKPDKGEILIFGDIPDQSLMRVGYMPQYAHLDFQFPINVMDVVLMGCLGRSWFGWHSKNDIKKAQSSLAEVKLADYAGRRFSELSGGQRQRVLIARALCCDPELLLLDEPTANIDPQMEEALIEILKRLNRHMTILLVTHDIGFVSQVVKSVICVNRQVVIHPTSSLNGMLIKEIYGGDFRMIRHDHRCSEKGHYHA
ncbi:zinc transport system ATP-binding protein [Desulfosarcina sp. BuS5]|uniref:metal ABC transporter ATP-binding protein n=1 Tax=Desulfosarcina sp. BuS5 TaxID=933262 RepID=UPI00048671B9|nr:ABC transporter ATP-binding protein [Desulfosarcina sp. BuS5]WDN87447.1 zinc transport system ATP-binding protein [Desulfosarcina sp. BuS5]